MTPIEIAAIQEKIGATPGSIWGRQSIALSQAHLASLMPKPNPWPDDSDQNTLTAFYGRAGDENQLVQVDCPIPMKYDGRRVRTLRVHRKCAPSLLAILNDIYERHGHERRIMKHVEDYAGIFNNRTMRGGTTPSLHARGAAIDLSAGTNGNHTTWPLVATMPFEIMEAFSRHGWISAGAFWGRDAMHFQATR